MKELNIGSISICNHLPLCLIAGPCVIENEAITLRIAEELASLTFRLGLFCVFKASFDKANRTSVDSFRGPGLQEGLRILEKVKTATGLPVLTDVHDPDQARSVAGVADILQIPAFLMRQTDLVLECARTGKPVNIKKAQFSTVNDVEHVIHKVETANNTQILLTERGSVFGYGDLVVDMRNFDLLKNTEYPVIFDATHSVQSPGQGAVTGGDRERVPLLTRAAAAAGIAGLFMEVHPDPDHGLSDAANMYPLADLGPILKMALKIDRIVKND